MQAGLCIQNLIHSVTSWRKEISIWPLFSVRLLQIQARTMSASAGTWHAAQRLLALEGRIPNQGVLCTSSFQFWQHWRRSVEMAQSPAELTPLVRAKTSSGLAIGYCKYCHTGIWLMAQPLLLIPIHHKPASEPAKQVGRGDLLPDGKAAADSYCCTAGAPLLDLKFKCLQ